MYITHAQIEVCPKTVSLLSQTLLVFIAFNIVIQNYLKIQMYYSSIYLGVTGFHFVCIM